MPSPLMAASITASAALMSIPCV